MTHAGRHRLQQGDRKHVRLDRNTFGEVSPGGGAAVASLKLIIYVLDSCAAGVRLVREHGVFSPGGLFFNSGRRNIWCRALNGAFKLTHLQLNCIKHLQRTIRSCMNSTLTADDVTPFISAVIFHQSISSNLVKHLNPFFSCSWP